MSNRIQQIKRMIAKNILPDSFKRTTDSIWYCFLNDMIVYIIMECPSTIIHVWFCVWPMFMPPLDFPGQMTFGYRIRQWFDDLRNGPYQTDDDSSIIDWCNRAKTHLQNELLPSVERVSYCNMMYTFWKEKKPGGLAHFISGDVVFETQLLMYAAVYLNKKTEAKELAARYLNCAKRHRNIIYVKQFETEVEQVEKMIEDERFRNQLFDDWRQKNMANYDRKMKRKLNINTGFLSADK